MQIRSPVDLKFVQEKNVSLSNQQPYQLRSESLQQAKQSEGSVESRQNADASSKALELRIRHFQLNRMPGVCRQYFCPYVKCLKQFKHSGDLRIHFRTHTNERPYQCQFCQSSFGKKALLNEHLILQTQQPVYKCQRQGCEASFVSNCLLRKHLRDLHMTSKNSSEKPKVVKQMSVNKQESKQQSLKQEAGEEEANQIEEIKDTQNQQGMIPQERTEVCFICGKKFAKRFSLQDHLFSHTMNSSFKCKFCDKTFKRERTLRIHKRLKHNAEVKQESIELQKSKMSHVSRSFLKSDRPINEINEVKTKPECDESCPPLSYLGQHQIPQIPNNRPESLIHPGLGVSQEDASAHLALIALQQQKIPLLEALTRQLQKQNAQRILQIALVNEARQNFLASQINPMLNPFIRPQAYSEPSRNPHQIRRPMPIYPNNQWQWAGVRSAPGDQLNHFNH